MQFQQDMVMQAFEMYNELALNGRITGKSVRLYKIDTDFRALVDMFCQKVDTVCIEVGEEVLLIPTVKLSEFHVSNDTLKKEYFRSKGKNEDLYMMYFATICVIGEFYNSFHTLNPTRSFITIDEWIEAINRRIESLASFDEETLKEKEKYYSYRWSLLIEKWEGLDDVKESLMKQRASTSSRVSFLLITIRFLQDQEILVEVGEGEYQLTEKTQVIIGNFFMDSEYNRGIIDFLFQLKEVGEQHADN